MSSTPARLFGVRGKVLGIDSKKILRPDPGLYSQYFPSYVIFCDSQIFIFVQNQVENWVSENLIVHQKCHNLKCIVSKDLGQVSKFSVSQSLKLFL